ncbi:MAG: hypothetical protein PHS49_07480 [Candidatus Gracilibacteria bacterium]|nr:hypothetical protein [Candidatus Gracilibacteria bacterium]
MKNLIILSLYFTLLFSSFSSYGYFYNDYYNESISAFINSPSEDDLDEIVDESDRYCEQVYLEATRRRDYTEIEQAICGDLFEIKRQQELDYITYMLKNRGAY